MLHRERHPYAPIFKPHIRAREYSAPEIAELFDQRHDVADHAQFFVYPAILVTGLVSDQLVMLPSRGQRLDRGIGRKDTRFHCSVRALNAWYVQKARRASDQRAARECELWHRLPATVADCARAI